MLVLLLPFSGNGNVNTIASKTVNIADTVKEYSFIVSGHFHGSSTNQSGYPASTVLSNLDVFNQTNFIIITGDLFLDIKNDIISYSKSFFSKLGVPWFNAVGNHDATGTIFEENFGPTYYMFRVQSEVFIILDTELDNGSINGEQLRFFKDKLNAIANDPTAKNLFIVSHRPIWCEDDKELKDLFKDNTRSLFSSNFSSEILPLLQSLTKKVKISWFSGSLGGSAPASFFYHEKSRNLIYIQSAIRNLQRDAVLKVMVKNGEIEYKTISLTRQPAPELKSCGVELWRTKSEEGFNARLIPMYLKQLFLHRYFWYGILTAIFSIFILRFVFKRFKSKKSAKA